MGREDERARDGAIETLLGTGLEEPADPLLEALGAVAELREALRRGDADAVRPKLDLHSWGAGRRGVLSTLAATRSVEEAVAKLAPFWRTAEYRMDAGRVVSPDEVEVYETIVAPGGETDLRTLTLMRRRGGHWRQVTSMDAPDEKLVAALLCPRAPVALPEAAGDARIETGGTGSLLRGSREGWVARVRDVAPPDPADVTDRRLREALGATARVISLALLPSRERAARIAQLRWFAGAVAALGEALGAAHAYLPWIERLMAPAALALPENADLDEIAARWVAVVAVDGWTGTRGMSHLMLPEVETRWIDWPDEEVATQIAVRAAEDLRDGECSLEPRTDVEVGGTRCRVDYGRRGAALGQTYGRYGAVRLAPSRV
ncbi:MAG: hypothetical protein KF729_28805 [Sandaracinaceae bacterium]|nr:hypothetical protein [Sandaracinaceae bacterium]